MSFTLAAKVMNLKIGSMSKKMVLLKLADQANDDGICWPSYQTIADACEVSRRTVIRHIKALEEAGYLEIHKSYDKTNKKNYSNRYKLTLDGGDKKSLVTNKAKSGDKKSPPSDNVSLSGDTVSPKPTNESINEPNKETNKGVYKPEKPESVSEQVWSDLLKHRKSKKTGNTQTAWTTIFNQLELASQKTGHSYNQIITEWIVADWKGFRSDWYANRVGVKPAIDRSTDKLAVNEQWRQGETNIVEANTDINDMFGGNQ